MKLNNPYLICMAMAVLALSSCTQDEADTLYQELPYGEYPLQIGGVTLSVEGSVDEWRTRITEATDGTASTWQGNEQIGVQLGDETGIYTVQADGSVEAYQPAYWQSTEPAVVRAWYPISEDIDLSDQSQKLAYVLQAPMKNATYNQPVNLTFIHKLAKVRVVLSGTQAAEVTQVEVNNYTQCRNNKGTVITQDSDKGWIQMHQVDAYTWEANVVPGAIANTTEFIRLNGTAMARVNNLAELTPAAMHTIDLQVGEPIIDLTPDNLNITQDGHYRVHGSFPYGITISGSVSPTLYLQDATVNPGSGEGISITGGANAILHVQGHSTVQTTDSYDSYEKNAAIYVEKGSSVTITGDSRSDVLVARTGCEGAGIGGHYDGDRSCGRIHIEGVTVEAYSVTSLISYPGIGAYEECDGITLVDALVHARGTGSFSSSSPAIGAYQSVPEIVIIGSEIHAYRGGFGGTSYADWIGRGGNLYHYQGGQIQADITGSTVHKYCYNKNGSDPVVSEGTVVYDASGNATEQ